MAPLPPLLELGVDAITSDAPHQLRAKSLARMSCGPPPDTVAGNRAAAM